MIKLHKSSTELKNVPAICIITEVFCVCDTRILVFSKDEKVEHERAHGL